MTLHELNLLTVLYIKDHQDDVDMAYESFQGKFISEEEYHDQIIHSNHILLERIIFGWSRLPTEDQITYYLDSCYQRPLSHHMTDEQKTAAIIIQDYLVVDKD